MAGEIENNTFAMLSLDAGAEVRQLSQAAQARCYLEQSIVNGLIFGPQKGSSIFLETKHQWKRQQLSQGILAIIKSGLDLFGKIEDPVLGLSDEAFESGLALFNGLTCLVIPKVSSETLLKGKRERVGFEPEEVEQLVKVKGYSDNRYGYHFRKTPEAYVSWDNYPVLFDESYRIPVIKKYQLNALKGRQAIPNVLLIEVLPTSERTYERGYREVKKNAIQGGRKQDVSQVLSISGASPEEVHNIIEGAKEQMAYVLFQGDGIGFKVVAVDDEGERVRMDLSLPEPLSFFKGENGNNYSDFTIVNFEGQTRVSTEFAWPNEAAKNFRGFLDLIDRCLYQVAKRELNKRKR